MNVSAQNPVCWMAEKQEWKTMEIIKFTEQQRKDYEQLPTDMAIYQTIDGSLRPCWWQMNCADCCGSAGKTWSLTWARACLVLSIPMISAGWLILARISRLTQMRNTMFSSAGRHQRWRITIFSTPGPTMCWLMASAWASSFTATRKNPARTTRF